MDLGSRSAERRGRLQGLGCARPRHASPAPLRRAARRSGRALGGGARGRRGPAPGARGRGPRAAAPAALLEEHRLLVSSARGHRGLGGPTSQRLPAARSSQTARGLAPRPGPPGPLVAAGAGAPSEGGRGSLLPLGPALRVGRSSLSAGPVPRFHRCSRGFPAEQLPLLSGPGAGSQGCLVTPRSLKSLVAAQDTPGCRRGCGLEPSQGGNLSVSHDPAVGPVPVTGAPSGLCQARS